MSIVADKESVCSLCRCHIKENTLFTGLNDAQLDAFKEAVVINHHKKREIVFMEGDDCSGLYIIRTGRVKVVRSSSTGKEQIINIMNPGDLLGFEVFYNARTYKQTAVVMEDCDLCYIDRHAFFKILEREPAIARKLIISLGKELNNAYERIGHLGLLNAKEKLAQLLYTLARPYGVKEDGGRRRNLTLSRLEIAGVPGLTQENPLRLLK